MNGSGGKINEECEECARITNERKHKVYQSMKRGDSY